MSAKIRNNYTAKQIFDDFSKEEKARLGAQLNAADEQLKLLIADEDVLKQELAKHNNGLAELQNKQNATLEDAKKTAQEALENADSLQQRNLADMEAAKKSKLLTATAVVGIIALLFVAFYYIGKKRKSKKNNI